MQSPPPPVITRSKNGVTHHRCPACGYTWNWMAEDDAEKRQRAWDVARRVYGRHRCSAAPANDTGDGVSRG